MKRSEDSFHYFWNASFFVPVYLEIFEWCYDSSTLQNKPKHLRGIFLIGLFSACWLLATHGFSLRCADLAQA